MTQNYQELKAVVIRTVQEAIQEQEVTDAVELARLKSQITQLQRHNTELVLENRRLRDLVKKAAGYEGVDDDQLRTG